MIFFSVLYINYLHSILIITSLLIIAGGKEVVCVEFFPSELRKYAMDVALRVELNNNKSRYSNM
jgi:hypothetical protein